MSRNTYNKLTPAATVSFINQLHSAIGMEVPNDFGVSQSQLTGLTTGSAVLTQKDNAVAAAKLAYHAAVLDRDEAHEAATRSIASVAATIYATPTATPVMIQSAGLKPRTTTKTKIVPVTPTGIQTTIESDSAISVRFKRAGNAPGVIFRVESRVPGGIWTTEAEGTATRYSLRTIPVGEARFIRVIALKNGQEAIPSAAASVYGAADVVPATPALRLAA